MLVIVNLCCENSLFVFTADFRQEGISNLIQNAVLHACMALAPVGIKLPGSGTHRIEQFCADILASLLSRYIHVYTCIVFQREYS